MRAKFVMVLEKPDIERPHDLVPGHGLRPLPQRGQLAGDTGSADQRREPDR